MYEVKDKKKHQCYSPADAYEPDLMSEKKCKAFLTWHADKVQAKEACLAFVREMEDLTGVNPLTSCVTIASTAFRVFQKMFLKPNLIALEPRNKWGKHQVNQSQEAIEWLEFEDSKVGGMRRIQHMRNSTDDEVKVVTPVQAYFVDGFDQETQTVYEFQGCWFHGCKRCFKEKRDVTRNCHPDRTVEGVYEATMRKAQMVRAAGYTVVEKWECEYKEGKKTDPDLQAFLKTYEAVPPLEPRDLFFGGRTGATTLYVKAEPGEEIGYQDFTSLYPYVNNYCEYPVGVPEIYLNPSNQNIHSYFGIVQVDVIGPDWLFHPVLPVREGGKLTFPLCGKCVKEEQEKPWLERSNMCGHSTQERTLHGTWCTPELQKAVEEGYQILKIHEVWHFTPENRHVGLFKDYVNTWLKLKQESAGWPAGCETPEQTAAYVKCYEDHESIKLENVAENSGWKAVAKMLLNS